MSVGLSVYCTWNFIVAGRLNWDNEISFNDVFYITKMYLQHYPFNVESTHSCHAKSLKDDMHFYTCNTLQ